MRDNIFTICAPPLKYRLRVVPLFETVKDLRGAGSVIRKLLSIDWYREHIKKNHNGHQEVLMTNQIRLVFPWKYPEQGTRAYICSVFCTGDGWIF